jgi:preprotein translocase subunit SecF
VELFRGVNVDWLGKKWYFLAFSLIFSVAGVLSMLFWHGIKLGIDFRGGTLVYVQFEQPPDLDRIRQAIDRAGIHDSRIQTYGTAGAAAGRHLAGAKGDPGVGPRYRAGDHRWGAEHELLQRRGSEPGQAGSGQCQPGFVGPVSEQSDPQHLAGTGRRRAKYAQQAAAILDHRDHDLGGIFSSIDQLNGVADPAVVNQLKQGAYLSGFHVFAADIIGPQVGALLRKQALLATLYSLLGMLVYLWFRFELIYGVAAVVAVFHDTLITWAPSA